MFSSKLIFLQDPVPFLRWRGRRGHPWALTSLLWVPAHPLWCRCLPGATL